MAGPKIGYHVVGRILDVKPLAKFGDGDDAYRLNFTVVTPFREKVEKNGRDEFVDKAEKRFYLTAWRRRAVSLEKTLYPGQQVSFYTELDVSPMKNSKTGEILKDDNGNARTMESYNVVYGGPDVNYVAYVPEDSKLASDAKEKVAKMKERQEEWSKRDNKNSSSSSSSSKPKKEEVEVEEDEEFDF